MSGSKIIDGLKEAVAGKTTRLHVDGQTWVRLDAFEELVAALTWVRTCYRPDDPSDMIAAVDAALAKARGE